MKGRRFAAPAATAASSQNYVTFGGGPVWLTHLARANCCRMVVLGSLKKKWGVKVSWDKNEWRRIFPELIHYSPSNRFITSEIHNYTVIVLW